MAYSVPNSLLAGLVAKWNSSALASIPLRYGRVSEGTNYPYACYFIVSDTPADAFDNSKILDEFEIEFGVYDVDLDNVANLINTVRVVYHRSSVTLTDGTVVSCVRSHSGTLIEPTESKQSANLYHGFVQFRVNVDG